MTSPKLAYVPGLDRVEDNNKLYSHDCKFVTILQKPFIIKAYGEHIIVDIH